jgi:quercetin dioxygenase-like cupin family protein
MLATDLNTVDLISAFPGLEVAFPLTSEHGTAAIGTVWINLEPGGEVPIHTDSAEELLVVLEGEVEAMVDHETGTLGERQMAIVPALAPHGLRNVSDRPARILGVFTSSTVVSVFDGEMFVLGAPLPLRLPLATA